MAVEQLEDAARHEVENQYVRAVTRDGQPGRAGRWWIGCSSCVDRQWRGIGEIPASGLGCARSSPRGTPSASSTSAGSRSTEPARLSRRRGAARPAEAARVPGIRHAAARPSIRWARRWCRARAPARRTTTTGAAARARRSPARPRRLPISRPPERRQSLPSTLRRQRRPRVSRAHRHHDRVAAGPRLGRQDVRAQLIRDRFLPHFDNPVLAPAGRRGRADRSAARDWPCRPTPSWCSPLEFPGGNIGSLAVHGTVNDLAMMGARAALPHGGVRARGRAADGPARPRHRVRWPRAARASRACRS